MLFFLARHACDEAVCLPLPRPVQACFDGQPGAKRDATRNTARLLLADPVPVQMPWPPGPPVGERSSGRALLEASMLERQVSRRTHCKWRVRAHLLAVPLGVSVWAALPADAAAQDTKAMISSFFRLPPGIHLADVTPEAFGSRADEVRKVRAFTFPDLDRTTIYVNVDSSLWKHAVSGDGYEFYRAVLASVVAHELWHLRHGASESGALREELRVWHTFIRDRLVPTAEGLQQAALLDREIRTAMVSELEATNPRRLGCRRPALLDQNDEAVCLHFSRHCVLGQRG
jgi:hypothetical protein